MNSFSELINEKNEINKIESKNIFKNLKSNYILQNLFYHLLKKKSLDMIKYNKNMKKRLNISIKDYKDYKEYLEIYSPIEIEIKPANNQFGNFINIDEENEKYYHIYFNNNEEEIKRNYINKGEKIKIIKIIIDYQVESFEDLFCNRRCVESIYFKKFYRNNINNMSGMFHRCSSLKELNLNNFNTNNVTNMSYMFYSCKSLTYLDISNLNCEKIKETT